MLKIDLSKASGKFLANIPTRHAKQLAQKLTGLRENPRPHDSLKLTNSEYFRTDVGEYRIIYEFDETCLYVLLIGKRNDDDVYRRLRRL